MPYFATAKTLDQLRVFDCDCEQYKDHHWEDSIGCSSRPATVADLMAVLKTEGVLVDLVG